MSKRTAAADDRWMLHATDRTLLGNKSGATRLGFAVLLKLFAAEGRFPRCAEDVPLAAVEAVAGQVGVAATAWQGYDWRGRTIEYHRAQIRGALGFREATLDDAEALGRWLDGQALALERRPDRLVAAARERCRDQSGNCRRLNGWNGWCAPSCTGMTPTDAPCAIRRNQR